MICIKIKSDNANTFIKLKDSLAIKILTNFHVHPLYVQA